MDEHTLTLIWLIGGALLALSELAVPGLVVIFLGLAAVVVGALRWLGLVESMGASLAVWMVGSVGLLLTVRKNVMRFFPSETTYHPHRPDLEASGQLVEVLEDIAAEGKPGRIRFEGTTWDALSQGEPIAKGSKARLMFRDNLVWMVEAVRPDELDAPPEHAALAAPKDDNLKH